MILIEFTNRYLVHNRARLVNKNTNTIYVCEIRNELERKFIENLKTTMLWVRETNYIGNGIYQFDLFMPENFKSLKDII